MCLINLKSLVKLDIAYIKISRFDRRTFRFSIRNHRLVFCFYPGDKINSPFDRNEKSESNVILRQNCSLQSLDIHECNSFEIQKKQNK